MKFTVKLVAKKRFRPLHEKGLYPHYIRVTYNSKTNDLKSPTFSNLYAHKDFEELSDQEIQKIIDAFGEIEKNDRRILERVFDIFQEAGIEITHHIFKSRHIEDLTQPLGGLVKKMISQMLVSHLDHLNYPSDFKIIARSHPLELLNVMHHSAGPDYLELTSEKEFNDLLKFLQYLNTYKEYLYTSVADCFNETFKSKFYIHIEKQVKKEYTHKTLPEGDDINYVIFMHTHWYDDAFETILKAINKKIGLVTEKLEA